MDKRRTERVHLFQRVQVDDGTQSLETFCLDISMRGILLVLPENVEWEEGLVLAISLVSENGGTINMKATLVHIDDDVVGCACESMDEETENTLRQVLESGLVVPTQINRELAELRVVH